MAGAKRSDRQIVNILKEAEASGNIREVCRQHGVTEQTFYRWRKRFPSFKSDAQRIQELLRENEELKKLVAEMSLENRQLLKRGARLDK